MRRHAPLLPAAVAATLASIASCTLVNPPGDYFDPSGTLVTVTLAPNTVDALQLTKEGVFFTAGAMLYRAPKSGGASAPIAELGAGRVARLATDGVEHVAFCERGIGVRLWTESTRRLDTLAGTSACEDVALSARGLAVVSVTTEVDGASRSYQTYDFAGRPTPTLSQTKRLPTGPSGVRIGMTDDDRVFFAVTNGLGVFCPPAGCGAARGTCFLSVFAIGELDSVQLGVPGAGVDLVAVATDLHAVPFQVPASPTCLTLEKDKEGKLLTTGLDSEPIVAPPRTVFIHRSGVYRVDEGALYRAPLTTPAARGAPLRSALGNDLRHLAVDDRFAFFVERERVQRVALP